jgi:enamine deaminase RidA (YjgF/YER057c/UK114 family)
MEQALRRMQNALTHAGFSLGDVVRTWFFLDDLLSWYDAFNEVRARVYAQTKFRSGCLPASTGISGRNPAGAALTVGAWAMQPLDAFSRAEEVLLPFQCPACAYGSLFSRGVEVKSGGFRRLLVSGTASIEPDGRTAHVSDVRAQIELSMQVVEAILESRRMSFADVTRATAYFKSPADAPAFAHWCDQRELRKLPVISAGGDICRRDLLFEVELDAIQAV